MRRAEGAGPSGCRAQRPGRRWCPTAWPGPCPATLAAFACCASVVAPLLLLGAGSLHAATRYDPALRFQSIRTEHFVIHYHHGEEAGALRLARLAEEVHDELAARYRHSPRGRTHVVLVNQSDAPNGWATPLPYNLMEITAAPPTGASFIGNTDDWLRLVFTHEYVHVLHLDQSRGWAAVARGVFGRTPFAFPNLTLPLWQIEGLATYEESRGGQGRVPAGDFHVVVGQAARQRQFEPIDRAGGGLVDWPGGTAAYAYGAYFHEYLARRYGDATLAELARRTAGRAPYLTAGAFKAIYRRSLGQLWREFESEQASRAADAASPAPGLRRLTTHGFGVSGPRFDRRGAIVYSLQDPHAFPSLLRLPASGGPSERLTTRYGSGQVTVGEDALYFDQLEFVRSVALQGDLYRLDRVSGRVRRLTHGARLAEADVSPDGRRLAVVQVAAEHRRLLIVDRAALEGDGGIDSARRIGSTDDIFATPRWSPDGRFIAAERRIRGGPSEIVLVDAAGGGVSVLVSAEGARHVTPAWTADGAALLFASDREGGPFHLYRAALNASRMRVTSVERVTSMPGGARDPDVSADGATVVFVGYTADGYDLFTLPLVPPAGAEAQALHLHPTRTEPGAASVAPPAAASDVAPGLQTGRPQRVDAAQEHELRPEPYRPWATLLPRGWLPLVDIDDDEVRAGATTGGADALGYHAWAATFTWSVARDEALEPVSPGARPDLSLFYAYDRWRATVFAQVSDETTPLLLRTDQGQQPVSIREQAVDLGVALPLRRVRTSQTLLALWRTERSTLAAEGVEDRFNRGAVRLGWSAITARRYGYSISPQDGLAAAISTELARTAFGSDGSGTFARADLRGYLPLGPRHAVLALRGSAAVSRGDDDVRRTLRLGGAGGDREVLSFDEDATSLLRGFPANSFLGLTVALLNAEYRLPLAYVERGVGTWPLFLRSLHAAAFVDAGHAWSGRLRLGDVKTAWGAEVGADVVAGYVAPFTLTAGVAWGRDGSGAFPRNREIYVRVGRGF
jgi:WD40-like Beta Propeller Repeat